MKARKIKTIAEVIVILSFLSQTLLFDHYNDKSNELDRNFTNQALIDKGADLRNSNILLQIFLGIQLLRIIIRKPTLSLQRLSLH
ncbi:hypothetical protein [Pedobacter agri]|uniref:hypothetical protein n=1 Tax=Pedobacter agri TaxID=454586 RepID=UPI00292E66C0|nr:hypothetical protein [Pedobacter agri]